MRAAVLRNKEIVVTDAPEPEPGPDEVIVKSLACGICGTDLHARKHAETMVEVSRRTGGAFDMDLSRDLIFGHEFCAELADYGPGTAKRIKPGRQVCSMPLILRSSGAQTVGLSTEHPGGYGQYLRLTESLLLEVPNGLATEHAALTEPMAVGLHAVEKARIANDEVPLVLGCGPVGLAVIATLKLKGVHPIVAADFSARRRQFAQTMGADVVVDPKQNSPYESWKEVAGFADPSKAPKFEQPTPPSPYRPAVIFECIGVPGIVSSIMVAAPSLARIVVVGVCLEPDGYEPFFGLTKELNIQFSVAYNGTEFAATLRNIAEGRLGVQPLITGRVGLDGVADAFEGSSVAGYARKNPHRPVAQLTRRAWRMDRAEKGIAAGPGSRSFPRLQIDSAAPRSHARVCIVTADLVGPIRNSGVGTAYGSLASILAQAGQEVTVLFSAGQPESDTMQHWVRSYASKGVTLTPLERSGRRIVARSDNSATSYQVFQWLRDHHAGFDVVHFPEWQGLSY